ncbi:MAG: hypothetical protein ABS81_16230 [Pseudonocardia sp. SCN 72-86]|nr:MAG: hypothetical protein ABS81_16230 [Pseudonocardia sp. SCN 72-86]
MDDEGDAGGVEDGPGAGEFRREIGGPGLADERTDLGERLPGDALDVLQLGLGPGGVDVDESAGELALEGDDLEGVAEDVVDGRWRARRRRGGTRRGR